jgi:dTDP-4-amino-4,6-dideoxygalactose transaminase
MFTRKRIDIGLSDLGAGLLRCLAPGAREEHRSRLEQRWAPDAIATLSVRSGFDLYLSALALPRGSEVLVSAVNIRDMIELLEHHGLVAVPVDLDLRTLAPKLDEAVVTGPTRAILVAHLFGSRVPMDPVIAFAQQHGLRVLEDCAQAFIGPGFTGDPRSDLTMFSFGPIKTRTALGGGLLCVRDAELLAKMRALEATRPVQRKRKLGVRLLKYAAIKLLSDVPLIYGWIARAFEWLKLDHDALIAAMTRSFSGSVLLEAIRRQPSAPLLALLDRRIARFAAGSLDSRERAGQALADLLGDELAQLGRAASVHSFWVFPVVTDDPRGLTRVLRRAGYDATLGGTSLAPVRPTAADGCPPAQVLRTLEKLVYVPAYPELPPGELERLATLIRATSRS